MNTFTFISIFVLILLIGGGTYSMYRDWQYKTEVATFPLNWSWEFQPAGTDSAAQAPKTTVTLTSPSGKAITAGTFIGNCFNMKNSSWKMRALEVEGVVCWWAGSGTEIGIFEKRPDFLMQKAAIDESTSQSTSTQPTFELIQKL